MSKFCLSYWVIAKELMPSNCGAGEDFWEPRRQQGDQPWIFTRITDTEAEAPVFWSSDVNRWLIGKVWWILGKIEGRKRRGHQRLKWLDSITDSMNMTLANSGRWGGMWRPGELQFMRLQRVGHDWATEQWCVCVEWVGGKVWNYILINASSTAFFKRMWRQCWLPNDFSCHLHVLFSLFLQS